MSRIRSGRKFASCPRCGIVRSVHISREPGLCIDCRHLELLKPEPIGDEPIAWERVGHIMRPILCHCGHPIAWRDAPCERCLTWAERDAIKASWSRPFSVGRSVA